MLLVLFSDSQRIDAEMRTVAGVSTFACWSDESQELMLLFHGCKNQGSDWFSKPEEILFLRQVLSKKISILAFTTPLHNGNWCWPSEGPGLEDALRQISTALTQLLQTRPQRFFSLILVGASSGGLFASLGIETALIFGVRGVSRSHLPKLWWPSLDGVAKACMWKVSPHSSFLPDVA